MSRPRSDGRRVSTAIRFNREVHDRLKAEADARMVSVSWLVDRAVADLLDRLPPLDSGLPITPPEPSENGRKDQS